MLQRDYIVRLVREFMEALRRVLEKDETARQDALLQLYSQYVGDATLFHQLSVDEIFDYLAANEPDSARRDCKIEMLAELFLAEGDLQTGPLREMLHAKSFAFFDYLSAHSTTYSLDRIEKMARLRKEISQSVE